MKLLLCLIYFFSTFAIGQVTVTNNNCYHGNYIIPYISDEDSKRLKLAEKDVIDEKKANIIQRSYERSKLEDMETKKKIIVRKTIYKNLVAEFNKTIERLERNPDFNKFGTFEITGLSVDVQDFDYNAPTDEVAADIFYCVKYTFDKLKLDDFLKWKSQSPFEKLFPYTVSP